MTADIFRFDLVFLLFFVKLRESKTNCAVAGVNDVNIIGNLVKACASSIKLCDSYYFQQHRNRTARKGFPDYDCASGIV